MQALKTVANSCIHTLLTSLRPFHEKQSLSPFWEASDDASGDGGCRPSLIGRMSHVCHYIQWLGRVPTKSMVSRVRTPKWIPAQVILWARWLCRGDPHNTMTFAFPFYPCMGTYAMLHNHTGNGPINDIIEDIPWNLLIHHKYLDVKYMCDPETAHELANMSKSLCESSGLGPSVRWLIME